ncbi:MAG: PAS domain S-box protein, partial [Spirochaetia bacterium]
GKTTEEFLLPETAVQVNANYRRCIEAGAPISYDETLDLPGGSVCFHTTIVPLRDGTGRIHRILGVAHDMTEHRRVEEALREGEQRYREVFENTSDGLFMVEVTPDQRYRLLEYNPAQEQMLQVPRSLALGKFNDEYLPKDAVDTVNKQNRQCIEAGKPMSFESALDLPTGRSYFHTTLVPIRDAQGRIHRLVGVARDMTENRRMVEALRQSEEKFSKAFHGSPDSITISSMEDGVLLEVNRGFMDVYGYAREEVIGRSSFPNDLGIWVNPGDRARMLGMIKQRGEALGESVPFRKKDGSIRYGLVSWRTIEIDGEKRLLSITRDVTERKVMEEALRDSEARFRLLAENSTDMISRHAPDGTFIYTSPACTALLGYKPEDLIGRSVYDLFNKEDLAEIARSHATILQQTTSYTVSYRIRRKDGTYTWFETVSHGIRDEQTGKVIEIQSASRDISERVSSGEREREHELQLFQASKLASLGTLVSGIAHEINNPNNYIRLNSQNLAEFWGDISRVLDDAASKGGPLVLHGIPYEAARGMVGELLGGIGEGSKRIEKLLLNLRDFARGDEGGLGERVELNKVVRSAVMIVQNLIQKSTESFTVQESPFLPAVRGNYHQLEQVVINLVTNACQALSSREKTITIATTAGDDRRWVTLSVADQGIGIPPANLPRVVDPFFTTKRQQGGSGLGLAVSSRII